MEIIAQKPMRLDLSLQKHLKTSRNQVEQLIKNHGVLVDGKMVFKTGLKLKGGEKIIVTLPQPEKESLKDLDFQKDSTDARFNIDIIFEDDDLLIINKPPHLVVHPAPSVKEPTLVDWLKHRGISLSTLSGEERHGIVHRIDKETSGALVIAKNNQTHMALSKQLEDKSMGRYYLAIIDLPLKENTIVDKPIARHPTKRIKMAISPTGKDAKSAFMKLATSQKNRYELIACKLYTGRTHQIRVHLESLSRHIINDHMYGFKDKKERISRVMLHAYLIYFIHPKSGKLIIKEAPLFEDFIGILSNQFDMEEIDEKRDPDTIISNFATYF